MQNECRSGACFGFIFSRDSDGLGSQLTTYPPPGENSVAAIQLTEPSKAVQPTDDQKLLLLPVLLRCRLMLLLLLLVLLLFRFSKTIV